MDAHAGEQMWYPAVGWDAPTGGILTCPGWSMPRLGFGSEKLLASGTWTAPGARTFPRRGSWLEGEPDRFPILKRHSRDQTRENPPPDCIYTVGRGLIVAGAGFEPTTSGL